MDTPEPLITVPGVVHAAGILHKARATRPALDIAAQQADAELRVMPENHPDRQATLDAWGDALEARQRNTFTRIHAAVELVDVARLELLQAVYDAAAIDGWSIRDLATAAGVSRGTIANILDAGGVKTARASTD